MPAPLSNPAHRTALADLKQTLAATAVERDRAGGTAKAERDAIRRSGLLDLAVPTGHGGAGEGWPAILGAVRELAQVDSSLAHLFAFQHLMVASVLLYGNPAQREALLGATARGPLFWGNALNPLDRRTTLVPHTSGGWILNGTKSFCSGASDSDLLLVSADDPSGTLRVLALPTARAGVAVLDDWDNMGQRQTDSGTVTFTDVAVDADDVLGPPGPFGDPASSLRPCIAQSILASIYLGIAEGALAAARGFTLGESRPWRASGVASAAEDPYILRHYGELHVAIAGAEALGDRALDRLQAAWERGRDLTPAERGEAAVAIATFKAASTRAALDATTRLFDVTGARATASRFGFDRFWRNVRTHSLHDPLDYKLKELGAWTLTGVLPEPGFYS
ncbi:alkylation response protein AidB-like acyl-CoA dehydrogenase [Azospirillum agricola]|uniref:acyl-CoA dehydrogenase family protein n=1 Tax=Azospirillum agricola TaxID=1720247 RepID=UPI001B3BFAA0|nr:acyl-CoA dehydrogenase family protein [Azospirillum agricola]MBP2231942.1 alkylation response protein AidB-like acyl-CoA dehydrogenase [Azospirillum agricola]